MEQGLEPKTLRLTGTGHCTDDQEDQECGCDNDVVAQIRLVVSHKADADQDLTIAIARRTGRTFLFYPCGASSRTPARASA